MRAFAVVLALGILAAPSLASAAERTVRVGVYENEPKVFTRASDGRPSGIFVDLITAIARDEGWSIVWVPGSWEAGLKALESGRIDLMPDVAYSEERDRKFDFHKTPVVESWSYVYSAPKMRIDRMSQLDGKRVAVLRGSIQETVFSQMARGFGYDVTLVPVDSLGEAFELASTGKADAAIANYLFGDYFHTEYGLIKTPIVFNAVPLFYAAPQGKNSDMLAAIDRHLDAWIAQPGSVYYRTLGRYTASVPEPAVPAYLPWLLGGIAGLLAVAAGIIGLLRWQVDVKTSRLVEANEELALAYSATLEGWSRALDLRDKETEGHTRRVTDLSVRLAREMGVDESEILHMRRGALLHDIGKLAVPDSILLKPSTLDDGEWAVMRKHPQYAHDMLSPIAYLQSSLDIPYCHHERWDGAGYPRGLAGEEIPRAARIFAVVDVWDALLSDRPYRPAWNEDEAREHIQAQAGAQFDPEVVEAFMPLISQDDPERDA